MNPLVRSQGYRQLVEAKSTEAAQDARSGVTETVGGASGPAPAPASLTPLQPRSRLRGMTDAIVKPMKETEQKKAVLSAVSNMRANHGKAMGAGVNTTNVSFWSKVFGTAVAALALGAVIAVTVSTAGVAPAAALTAAAVIAGVVFAVSVADAGCAWMNFQNAKANKRGDSNLPYNLPMGSSSIGNLLHRCATAAGASGSVAKRSAHIMDGFLRVGMAVAAGACTMGVTLGAESIGRIAPMVASAATVLQSLVDFKHNRSMKKVYTEGTEDLKINVSILKDLVEDAKLEPNVKIGLEAEIDAYGNQAKQEFASVAQQMPAGYRGQVGPGLIFGFTVAVLTTAALGVPIPYLPEHGDMRMGTHMGGTSSGLTPKALQNPADKA